MCKYYGKYNSSVTRANRDCLRKSIILLFRMINTSVLDWRTCRDSPHQELFQRMTAYCVEHLKLNKKIFSGQNEFFGEYTCDVNLSGGWEWFNPTYSVVLGLHHHLTQDELDNHAIAFHGTRKNSNVPAILSSKLKPGPGQAYKGKVGRNPNVSVPNGVYCSPFLTTALGYTDHSFPIVIQIASPHMIVTGQKQIAVVQDAIPIALVFPMVNAPRQALQ